jgi:hypothetical protein
MTMRGGATVCAIIVGISAGAGVVRGAIDTMVTRTVNGLPGDPINVGLVGSRDDVLCAMHAAAWYLADPVTPQTSAHIVSSILHNEPYPNAPVSDLIYHGKRQDLAFEKAVGTSAERRHHVRFWRVFDRGDKGRSVWLGAATFDQGIKRTRDGRRVTHQIAPDIDAERNALTAHLTAAKVVEAIYEVTGIGSTDKGYNGEGDVYYTDGNVKISVLFEGCNQRAEAAAIRGDPPSVAIKNLDWDEVAKVILLATAPKK